MVVWLSDLIPTQNADMDKKMCENEEVYRMQGLGTRTQYDTNIDIEWGKKYCVEKVKYPI